MEQGRQVFLLASLVEREQWAQRCLQHGAIEVSDVGDIQQCLGARQQPHREPGRRDQLTLGLA
jgi:hypothetical protein